MVRLAGRVAKQGTYAELKGAIEYVACCPGGKKYEALFVCPVDPEALGQALKKIGLEPGKPAREENGKRRLPEGGRVRIKVEWLQGAQKRQVPLETLVLDTVTSQPMRQVEWVFTGSRQVRDPASGKTVLEAKLVQNLIALHHLDASVLLQNPLEDAQKDSRYQANLPALPPEGTAVTLLLEAASVATKAGGEPKTRRVHLLISGRVQGVGFRAFTQRYAQKLGIKGWVRNLPTGEVELAAEGPEEAMAEFEKQVRQGPRWAKVEAIKMLESAAKEPLGEFKILPTPAQKP